MHKSREAIKHSYTMHAYIIYYPIPQINTYSFLWYKIWWYYIDFCLLTDFPVQNRYLLIFLHWSSFQTVSPNLLTGTRGFPGLQKSITTKYLHLVLCQVKLLIEHLYSSILTLNYIKFTSLFQTLFYWVLLQEDGSLHWTTYHPLPRGPERLTHSTSDCWNPADASPSCSVLAWCCPWSSVSPWMRLGRVSWSQTTRLSSAPGPSPKPPAGRCGSSPVNNHIRIHPFCIINIWTKSALHSIFVGIIKFCNHLPQVLRTVLLYNMLFLHWWASSEWNLWILAPKKYNVQMLTLGIKQNKLGEALIKERTK